MPEESATLRYLTLWFRMLFGAHLLYSSLRYFIGFEVVPPFPNPVAAHFVDAITAAGIYHVVKSIELVSGTLLVCNLFVPLVLVVEVPISMVIFILNFFVIGTGRQRFSGPQELVLNAIPLILYGRYYMRLFDVFARPRPLWAATRADLKFP